MSKKAKIDKFILVSNFITLSHCVLSLDTTNFNGFETEQNQALLLAYVYGQNTWIFQLMKLEFCRANPNRDKNAKHRG